MKKGADKGIDGRLFFHDEATGGKTKQIILSVQGGGVTVKDLRDLRGVIEREEAEIGVLITLEEPTKPMSEATTTTLRHDDDDRDVDLGDVDFTRCFPHRAVIISPHSDAHVLADAVRLGGEGRTDEECAHTWNPGGSDAGRLRDCALRSTARCRLGLHRTGGRSPEGVRSARILAEPGYLSGALGWRYLSPSYRRRRLPTVLGLQLLRGEARFVRCLAP